MTSEERTSAFWNGRKIDLADDEARWREYFSYTARLEVPFCAMVAWVPRDQAQVRKWESVPPDLLRRTKLVEVYQQAAGHLCHHMIIFGFSFELSPWGYALAHRTVLNYWQHLGGYFESHIGRSRWLLESPVAKKQWPEEQRVRWCQESAERVERYRHSVKPLSTECLVQPQRIDLCESFYPFDLSDENLSRVAVDPEGVKADVQTVAEHFDPAEAVLCVVAENSD